MIISASRRTDIPAFYAKWLINRIEAGFVYVSNPMNRKQVSQITLTPDVIDCIVFWTKNPAPVIPLLPKLDGYNYYFQFTVTPYDNSIERSVPPKGVILDTFKRLSDTIGSGKVIWRYDPVFITGRYSLEFHINAFRRLAKELEGYTEKCIISFLDVYAKTAKHLEGIDYRVLTDEEIQIFAAEISAIAGNAHMLVETCAEAIDLSKFGIQKGRCIDAKLIEKISGKRITVAKDSSQRPLCACAESIDIGTYTTCPHQCLYCYANHSDAMERNTASLHFDDNPLIFGRLTGDETISLRPIKTLFVENNLQTELL